MYDDPEGLIPVVPQLPDDEISVGLTLLPLGGGF
jgi:hypothetical protein